MCIRDRVSTQSTGQQRLRNMTYFHFVNCVAFTFAPSFVVYKTRLSDFGALWILFYAILAYVVAQGGKLILIATLMPTTDETGFHLTQELLKGVIAAGDIFCIYKVLNLRSLGALGYVRILGVGLGWATAESILLRLAPMWIGARKTEFSWDFLKMGLEANINMLMYLGFTALVWLWSREQGRKERAKGTYQSPYMTYIVTGLLAYTLFPLVQRYLASEIQLAYWYMILVQATFSVAIALMGYQFHQSYVANKQKRR
eukprot:TRINITY_DN4507_c0_g1_i1.p1 TRINITY_DN4507_c0_g1~~TRINITY_DN4507_c0_g1_i1.p1  ORF type:complete len:257 (-),score=15.43 TRINITY_DN4507_c0_g1_i1:14-784(-)